MAYTTESFFAAIKPMVIRDMQTSGILASLTAAQALIESNKGNSGLAVRGNNLFGMKGEYNGQSVTMPTKEYDAKRGWYTINAKFRKYPSWQESISDHSGLFNRASRYSNLRGQTDYKIACQRVHEDGYATSPSYSKTLINTIEKYKLYEWDIEAAGASKPTDSIDGKPKTGNPYSEPEKAVRMGSKGNSVRWMQYQLNLYGYRLFVDGIAGSKTIGALLDFQSKHGLDPDGVCGPLTRTKLKEAG